MKIWKNLFGRGDKIHADEIAVAPGLLLGRAVIVESGSNANGRYIKWGDGTMVCRGRFASTISTNVTDGLGSGWYRNATSRYSDNKFLVPFVEIPDISYLIRPDINTDPRDIFIGMDFSTTTTVLPQLISPRRLDDADIIISYVAIGRWK